MTDEEKAKEYADTHCCYYRQDFIRAYLDGLADGRKELEKELGWITDTDNYVATKLERCIELEKENEELKAKLNQTHCVECAREYLEEIRTLKAQIEKFGG